PPQIFPGRFHFPQKLPGRDPVCPLPEHHPLFQIIRRGDKNSPTGPPKLSHQLFDPLVGRFPVAGVVDFDLLQLLFRSRSRHAVGVENENHLPPRYRLILRKPPDQPVPGLLQGAGVSRLGGSPQDIVTVNDQPFLHQRSPWPLRRRSTSYIRRAAATEALREATRPATGKRTSRSQVSSISRLMPRPSLPMPSARGRVPSASVTSEAASGALPTIDNPDASSSPAVRRRLVTRTTGTYSTAPAEALPTAGVRPAARRFGMITPWAPAASAVRRMEPKLWGSSIPSRRMKKGASSRSSARRKRSSSRAYLYAAASAATPW